ncbi:BatD family protein, partial [Candidatus Omnitrophota bacterium]
FVPIILVLATSFLPAFAQDPAVKSEAPGIEVTSGVDKDKPTINIGDRIKYTIRVTAKADTEVELPAFKSKTGDFGIRDRGTSEKTIFGKTTIDAWYILTTFKTGDLKIPEATVTYMEKGRDVWREAKVPPVPVKVESVLESAKNKSDIRDIKNPLFFPKVYMPFLRFFAGAILLFLIILAILYLRKKIREARIKATTKLPYEIALEKLEALKQSDLIKKGMVKEYYFELSDILRHYLEERFHMKAPEMTTEEFLAMLKIEAKLILEHKTLLKEFLQHCDLVKFAKYGPSKNEIELSFDSARKLVEQTKEEEKKEEITV